MTLRQMTILEMALPDVAPRTKVHLSWSDDQTQILRTISTVYNRGFPFECDPMYNAGSFYKRFPGPRWKYDLNPTVPGCEYGDATDLPLDDDSVLSVILDPPFLVGNSKTGVMKERYTKIPTMEALRELYFGIVKEAYRILMPKGILVFKIQDVVSGGIKHPLSFLVHDYCESVGFAYEDMLTLVRHNPMPQPARKAQQHTRSADCKFFVFRKGHLTAKEQRIRAAEAN